jgi:hypothetical protein
LFRIFFITYQTLVDVNINVNIKVIVDVDVDVNINYWCWHESNVNINYYSWCWHDPCQVNFKLTFSLTSTIKLTSTFAWHLLFSIYFLMKFSYFFQLFSSFGIQFLYFSSVVVVRKGTTTWLEDDNAKWSPSVFWFNEKLKNISLFN